MQSISHGDLRGRRGCGRLAGQRVRLPSSGERFDDEAGRVELAFGAGRVMPRLRRSGLPRASRRHAEECEQARRWLDTPYAVDGVLVEIEDFDAHLARAARRALEILRGLEDQPFGRLYTAADPEGHRWMFFDARPEHPAKSATIVFPPS